MNKRKNPLDMLQYAFKNIPNWLMNGIGLITLLMVLVISFRNDQYLYSIIMIAVIFLYLLVALAYVIFKRESGIIIGQVLYKYQRGVRFWALMVLFLVFGTGIAMLNSVKGQEYLQFAYYGTPTLTPSQTLTASSFPTITSTSSPRPVSDNIHYLIVFDSSQNMNESYHGQSKWLVARNMLVEIMNGLNPSAQYNMAIIGGSGSAGVSDPCNSPSSLLLPSFSSRQDAYENLVNLQPQGGGSFYRAYTLAKKQFEDLPKDTIKTLIFITGTSDTCEKEDEWMAIRSLMSSPDSTFNIYSQIIVLDDKGIRSRTLAEQFSSLSNNDSTPTPAPIDINTMNDIETIPGFDESIDAPQKFVSVINPNVSLPDAVGKIKSRYPQAMLPGSSDFVNLSVYIPEELVNIKLSELVQISPEFGELPDFDQNIGVSKNMHIELTSNTFEIESNGPTTKQVNTTESNVFTHWQWTIKAPQSEGVEYLLLNIYLNQDDVPFLTKNLPISVNKLTATPSYTSSGMSTVTISPYTNTPPSIATAHLTPFLTSTPVAWYMIDKNVSNLGYVIVVLAAIVFALLIWIFIGRLRKNFARIFISYRRSDSADVAGRIYDKLAKKFGRNMIFKDVDSIPLGFDFRKFINGKLMECKVMLVIIGDKWLSASDSNGRRRLDDPEDFVRIEIESALARGIRVIPLLVSGAQIPNESNLPPGLRKLVNHNGTPIRSDPDFHRDMERLMKSLEKDVK